MKLFLFRSLCILLLSAPLARMKAQECPPRDLGGFIEAEPSMMDVESDSGGGEANEPATAITIELAHPERAETWLDLLPLHGKAVTVEGLLWQFCSMDRLRLFLGKDAVMECEGEMLMIPDSFEEFALRPTLPPQHEHRIHGTFHIEVKQEIPKVRLLNPTLLAEPPEAVELAWEDLSVEFKDVYFEALEAYYWKPEFEDKQLELDGRRVRITGYVFPVDIPDHFWMLTRYTNGCRSGFTCCSFPSPDQAIDVRSDTTFAIPASGTYVQVTGTLKLNADDVYRMNYILENVSVEILAESRGLLVPPPPPVEKVERKAAKRTRKRIKGRKPYTL